MQENIQGEQNGVVVPQQTVADSAAKKQRQKRSLAQLPVYRAAGNLLYFACVFRAHISRFHCLNKGRYR